MFDPNLSDRQIKTLLEKRLEELSQMKQNNEDDCIFRVIDSTDLSFCSKET